MYVVAKRQRKKKKKSCRKTDKQTGRRKTENRSEQNKTEKTSIPNSIATYPALGLGPPLAQSMDDHVCFAFRAPAVKLPSNGEASMGTSAAIPSRRRVQGTFSSASKQLHAQCNAMLIRPGLLQYRYQRPPPYPRQLATICHVHEFHLSRDSEVRKREKTRWGTPPRRHLPSSVL